MMRLWCLVELLLLDASKHTLARSSVTDVLSPAKSRSELALFL